MDNSSNDESSINIAKAVIVPAIDPTSGSQSGLLAFAVQYPEEDDNGEVQVCLKAQIC